MLVLDSESTMVGMTESVLDLDWVLATVPVKELLMNNFIYGYVG